jgi:NTE family protein
VAAPTEVSRPTRALVLPGGGARGAYEAGVLRYVLEDLPKQLGHPPRLSILCGSSVGAIHTCYLAATCERESGHGSRLAKVWSSLDLERVASLRTLELIRTPLRAFGLLSDRPRRRGGKELPDRLHGLLDTRPLERIVAREVAWKQITRNLDLGLLDAVCVTATEIATGRVVSLVQTRGLEAPDWTHDEAIVARAAELTIEHALASAAIPVLFPAVRIGETYYADGGLRLNTPLAPALRLGADRVLVVALRHGIHPSADESLQGLRIASYTNPLFLYGKVLNALLLDHVETDLRQMRVINALLESGERAFGDEFLERIDAAVRGIRGQSFRRVEELVVRPSEDLGELAGKLLAQRSSRDRIPRWIRLALGSLGVAGDQFEGDLLSYLLFDAVYTAPLVELGYRDAQNLEDEFLRFFSD